MLSQRSQGEQTDQTDLTKCARRKKIEFENTIIPLVPIKVLIAMKEKSDRPQDKADVFYLRKIAEDWKHEG